ncbi:hypothetical protein Tsp_13538 [Trichinella spiralis]|uniref:hypothetical protein n=1 Tax=Trichinella spiralis TaxID=6334 RepID=UPI0001EFEF6E|nr:hypothetical protein Tsp_13538 [Trichinella spiralis]
MTAVAKLFLARCYFCRCVFTVKRLLYPYYLQCTPNLNLCIAFALNTIYFSFHWGSERGVNVSLAWVCAELLYRGSSPDMKKENCGVKRSAKTVCRANKQKLKCTKQGLGRSQPWDPFAQ